MKLSSGEVGVAVKMLKAGACEEEKVKFLQEAAINGQFHHPNIVKLLGVVTVGEPVSGVSLSKTAYCENVVVHLQVMIVLELMKNGNLKNFLSSRKPGQVQMTDYSMKSLYTAILFMYTGKMRKYQKGYQVCSLTFAFKWLQG